MDVRRLAQPEDRASHVHRTSADSGSSDPADRADRLGLGHRVRGHCPPNSSGVVAAPESQALLILLSDSDGLRRSVVTTKLLATFVPQYILDLSIKNGVLVIHQNFGMTDVTDLTHRFRLEPGTERFLLIGKDTFPYHRPQGPMWPVTKVSENYLTGVKLTTTDHWVGDDNRPVTKRGRISKVRLFLEDIDESTDN